MTDLSPNTSAQRPAGGGSTREPLPRWKKVWLGVAGAMVVVGLLLGLLTGGDEPTAQTAAQPQAAPTQQVPGVATALVEPGPGQQAPQQPATAEGAGSKLSPGLTIMGFSFFVGFAMGYALRAFFRIAMVVVGLVFLVLVGFSYVELVTVNWDVMEQMFNNFAERMSTDFDDFATILTGRLPQAGLGAAGLFVGFRKK